MDLSCASNTLLAGPYNCGLLGAGKRPSGLPWVRAARYSPGLLDSKKAENSIPQAKSWWRPLKCQRRCKNGSSANLVHLVEE